METKPKLQTIDECCGQPEGSFAKHVKEQEEKERQEMMEWTERVEKHSFKRRFRKLVDQWEGETGMLSLMQQRYSHPAYQEILKMGSGVIPLIIEELKTNPDHWFDALRTLTGENPAKDLKTFDEACESWIKWGQNNLN
jgi:hypothetical protein